MEHLLTKGGYMPIGTKFWDVYDAIKDTLKPYGIKDIVNDYRDTM